MPSPPLNPADIAREAFRQLATRRIAPTPDAYRTIYDAIAGERSKSPAEDVLQQFADMVQASGPSTQLAEFGQRLAAQYASADWAGYAASLGELADACLKPQPISPQTQLQTPLQTHLPTPLQTQPPDQQKDHQQAATPIAVTAPSFAAPTVAAASTGVTTARNAFGEEHQVRILRDMLTRTLLLAVVGLLVKAPDLAADTELLGRAVKEANSDESLDEISMQLKQLCFRIEMRAADLAEEHELLVRLFKLLMQNVGEMVEDDRWLRAQLDAVNELIDGPIDHHALQDATRSLKEVIFKQSTLKHNLAEAKVTVKNMMITFIDRLGALAATTGDYHEKIDSYARKISAAGDKTTLNNILDDVMRDTRDTQSQALRSRDEMIAARRDVQGAEERIHELEIKLEKIGELVREDVLTGSLNRRGMEDVFERELARADRRHSPLCIAMLDLDDFKRLNDTYGHIAGDEALVYLVRVIKDTLRTMDMIARFGGEEFLLILPDTALEDALQTVKRVQRELTKRIFMYNNERLLITFSAGVVLRSENEDQLSMIKRADAALYKAKRAGKNRVVSA